MNQALFSDDEVREKSFTSNANASAAYNSGIEALKKEDYKGGIRWFKKAVELDPEFVFAWDNLGICYRRSSQFAKAEAAYQNSLKVDPRGRTALMNLPVVYMLDKRPEDAIAAYRNLLSMYQDDPEPFYGIGVVYLENKSDAEAALPYLCKAYNLYIKLQSPYRSDAEKLIANIYARMKKDGKEARFHAILKEHAISAE